MPLSWNYVILILLAGCAGNGDTETDAVADLPPEIRQLDNLTVWSADVQPEMHIELTEEVRFESTEEVWFTSPRFVAVDESDRVFIDVGFNAGRIAVLVYDSEGNYLTSIGRRGRGPGEFSSTNGLLFHDGMLFVYDAAVKLVHSFNLNSLDYFDTIYLHPANVADYAELRQLIPAIMPLKIRPDDRFLVRYSQRAFPNGWKPENPEADGYDRYFILSEDGQKLEREVRVQTYSFLMPGFNPGPEPIDTKPLFTAFDDARFLTARSDYLVIREYDQDGIYRRAFYHLLERVPMNRERVEALFREQAYSESDERETIQELGQVSLPDFWPALESMMVDDENRIWVSTVVDNFEVYEWWILDENGALMARFEWPRDRELMEIRNGYLYSREETENGISSIVKYRIEMQEQ